MATHLDAVLTTEVGNLVSALKVPDALLRMDFTWFPVVLCSNAIELFNSESLLGIVTNVTLIQRYTDGEIILVSILQADILSGINLTKLCP